MDPMNNPFIPVGITPGQFYSTKFSFFYKNIGEFRLVVAILEDAISLFLKYCHPRTTREQHIFHETEEWFTARDQSWFFSFQNICSLTGLDPEYIYEGLLKWKEKARTIENPESLQEELKKHGIHSFIPKNAPPRHNDRYQKTNIAKSA